MAKQIRVKNRVLKYATRAPTLKELGPAIHLWLGRFEEHARAGDLLEIKNLFHEKATWFWNDRDLPSFTLDIDKAKLIDCQRTFVVSADWSCKSRIIFGNDRHGFATFVLRLFQTRIVCIHVHIS